MIATIAAIAAIAAAHPSAAHLSHVAVLWLAYLWLFAPLSAIITPTICGRNMRISPRSVAAICGCHRYTGRFVLSRMMSWQTVSIQALLTNEK